MRLLYPALFIFFVLSCALTLRKEVLLRSSSSLSEKNSRIEAALEIVERRDEFVAILEDANFSVGAELGVLSGEFAAKTLKIWTKCTRYYLVDLWAHQENYIDVANADDTVKESHFRTAQQNLGAWKNIIVFLKMLTSEAIHHIPDGSLDYVYIDARHDYCGVMEDLYNYWAKVRSGGIVAGHDFLTATEQYALNPADNWSILLHAGVTILQ